MALSPSAGQPADRGGSRPPIPRAASAAVVASQRRRIRFVFGAALFLLAFNILQPVLSVFTRLLDPPAIGPLTWGWLFGFAQFVVPLLVLHVYVARSDRHDRLVAADQAGTPRGDV